MRATLGLAAAALAVVAALAPPRPDPRPDVVLIVIDTLRKDHLPAYGYARDTAPFLSRLAARGVVFDNAYSTAPWTAPATASLFTGRYPFQHGVVSGRLAVKKLLMEVSVSSDLATVVSSTSSRRLARAEKRSCTSRRSIFRACEKRNPVTKTPSTPASAAARKRSGMGRNGITLAYGYGAHYQPDFFNSFRTFNFPIFDS